MEPAVVDILLERERAMTLTFADGVTCTFALADLRAACPCASCRGWRERGELSWPRPGQARSISVVDAELHGAWGISIRWSDGHDTGIYPWERLRAWHDAGGPAEEP